MHALLTELSVNPKTVVVMHGKAIYRAGKIPAIVMTAKGKRHYTSQTPYNHYSLLSTLEWNWNLPTIGNASDTVNVKPMTEFFTR